MNGLNSLAIAMHELFDSYKRAGFTEAQAFELTKVQVAVMGGATVLWTTPPPKGKK